MTHQPNLFHPCLPTDTARQGELFRDNRTSDLRCAECGQYLVRTDSGYLACPRGHGRLLEAELQEPCGSWFDPDPWSDP